MDRRSRTIDGSAFMRGVRGWLARRSRRRGSWAGRSRRDGLAGRWGRLFFQDWLYWTGVTWIVEDGEGDCEAEDVDEEGVAAADVGAFALSGG